MSLINDEHFERRKLGKHYHMHKEKTEPIRFGHLDSQGVWRAFPGSPFGRKFDKEDNEVDGRGLRTGLSLNSEQNRILPHNWGSSSGGFGSSHGGFPPPNNGL